VRLLERGRWLGLFFAIAAVSPACRYSVDPDSGKFHCDSDSDCGGGWHCFSSCQSSGFSAYCLKDGSCEACPDLADDPNNCGTCGTVCPPGDGCIDGVCISSFLADAGEADAGLDGGEGDAGTDAGFDGGLDAGEDAGRDAGSGDAGLVDGGRADASVDAGKDAGESDGSVDSGIEDGGSPDGSSDAGSVDAGDGGADASVDAGDDGGGFNGDD
jgi:hypothetical protein